MAKQKIINVDPRGRTSLARIRTRRYDRYLGEEQPDGTLILTPLVTVPAIELAALQSPSLSNAVMTG